MRAVHLVLPDSVDDPDRPSGGNVYDSRVAAGLGDLGWRVHRHLVAGTWPHPDAAARTALAATVGGIGDGEVVLLDGLVGSCSPEVVQAATARLAVVVLVHLPLGEATPDEATIGAERQALTAATLVVTTSHWSRDRLLDLHRLDPDRVVVATPGVDPAPLAGGTPSGGRLLCVAALLPAKGHDQLLAALARLADLDWRLTCAGSADLDRHHVASLVSQARAAGIAGRVDLVGPVTGRRLEELYAACDLLVLASRFETYGLVITEALSRGVPVVATQVGGVAEALGRDPTGEVPGVLVPDGDPDALSATLRSWLERHELRERLQAAARRRRPTLAPWASTAEKVSGALRHAGERTLVVPRPPA